MSERNAWNKERASKLERAYLAATDAIYAIAMQRRRMEIPLEKGESFIFRREADLRFLLLASRWLKEACINAAETTDEPTLHSANSAFNETCPNLKDIRDVYEHLAAYIDDKGHLQNSQRVELDQQIQKEWLFTSSFGVTDEGDLTYQWVKQEINVDQLVRAAKQLYASLLDARTRYAALREV